MTDRHADIIVVGAGVAGLSVGAELAATHKIVVVEREPQPGYHTSGRSAAVFSETYGSELVRAITRASRTFYNAPPDGFAAQPLLEPCGELFIARDDQIEELQRFAAEAEVKRNGRILTRDGARAICPVLRDEYVAAGLFEPAAASIDVAAVLDGYRRLLRERGGLLVLDSEAAELALEKGLWRVSTPAGRFSGEILVNAAGAWADQVARSCGVAPIGLQPLRRTAVVARADGAEALRSRALVIDIDEEFYFRAESGGVLVSPADETLSEPTDAQPDEIDVAIAIDRLMRATTLEVRAVRSKWAGLRSFVPDRNPVVGRAPDNPQFFWLAGQGGYGFQTAPAISQLAAALVLRRPIPEKLGLTAEFASALSPARLQQASAG